MISYYIILYRILYHISCVLYHNILYHRSYIILLISSYIILYYIILYYIISVLLVISYLFILYKLYHGEAYTIIEKQAQTRNAYIDIELNIVAALPQTNPCTPLTAPLGIHFCVSRVVANKSISGAGLLLAFLPCFLFLTIGFTDRLYCIRYCVQVVI